MSSYVVARQGRVAVYGAEELKQMAHSYGFTALSISILIHFSVIGIYYLNELFPGVQTFDGGHTGKAPVVILNPPPKIPGVYELPSPPSGPVAPRIAEKGALMIVPDDAVKGQKDIASQVDLAKEIDPLGAELPENGNGVGRLSVDPIDDNTPPPIFRAVEKAPVLVKAVLPVYPPMAIKAELEGKVVVNIWVDKQGKVCQVVVLKSNYEIFNDAAIEAAKQFIFTPAYMNSGPVAVWVAIPLSFKLKGSS